MRTYHVLGMTCEHCQRAIQSGVGAVDGVRTVEVDLEHEAVRVEGDAADDAVRAAIVGAGYEVADPA